MTTPPAITSVESLLFRYMSRFCGYGTFNAAWWLVGMEEGGGRTLDEVTTRLSLWDSRGRRELEDVSIFESDPDMGKWFTPRPPLQPTWRGIARLVLAAEGRSTDAEAARRFQGTELGRVNGNNCLLELLPLPSQAADRWAYGDWFSAPELRSRDAYVQHVLPYRIALLRERILAFKPKVVVFYSRSYQAHWGQITGLRFGSEAEPGFHMVTSNGTTFVMTKHPTYPGVTTEYFVGVGRRIAGDWR